MWDKVTVRDTHTRSVLSELVLPQPGPCTLGGGDLALHPEQEQAHDAEAAKGDREEGQHCHVGEEEGGGLGHRSAHQVDGTRRVVEPLRTAQSREFIGWRVSV